MNPAYLIRMSTNELGAQPDQQGRRHDLPPQGLTLGASSDADILIDELGDEKIRIFWSADSDGWYLQSSENADILINDVRCRRTPLSDGDLIKTGEYAFKFLSGIGLESEHYATMYRMIVIDFLTQVFNRQYFFSQLDRELARCIRHQRPLTVAILDLDHFKQINDTFGHLAGDAVLKEVAHRIKGRVRVEDLFARLGGEEFAFLLPETNREQALAMAEQVRELVANQPVQFEGKMIPVTISMGIAIAKDHPNALDLIKIADENLYKAKELGRNQIVA